MARWPRRCASTSRRVMKVSTWSFLPVQCSEGVARMAAASTDRTATRYRPVRLVPLALLALVVAVHTAAPKFFVDDPLSREPETGDASKAEPWDIDLYYDL